MKTPTIVKQTKDYMIVKIPLPRQATIVSGPLHDAAVLGEKTNGKLTRAEKRLWKALRESERDVKAGRVITATNITEAVRRYEKRAWD